MGQGDVNRKEAWTSGTPTLGSGTVAPPAPQGGIAGDASNPGSPDIFVGSFTLKSGTPTLVTGAVATPTGKGDVGDIEGFPDLANNSQVRGLAAFTTGAPTLVTQAHATPTTHGDVGDVGMSPTPKNEWNDSNAGTGTLVAWNSAPSTLATGVVSHPGPQGDIDAIYSPNEHFAGVNSTWQPATPTLGLSAFPVVTGGGDIVDPFAWRDTIIFLTSNIYPFDVLEHFTSHGGFSIPPQYTDNKDDFTSGMTITGGSLTTNLISYTNWIPEHFQSGANVTGGDMHLALVVYGNWPAEHFQSGMTLTGGSLA